MNRELNSAWRKAFDRVYCREVVSTATFLGVRQRTNKYEMRHQKNCDNSHGLRLRRTTLRKRRGLHEFGRGFCSIFTKNKYRSVGKGHSEYFQYSETLGGRCTVPDTSGKLIEPLIRFYFVRIHRQWLWSYLILLALRSCLLAVSYDDGYTRKCGYHDGKQPSPHWHIRRWDALSVLCESETSSTRIHAASAMHR